MRSSEHVPGGHNAARMTRAVFCCFTWPCLIDGLPVGPDSFAPPFIASEGEGLQTWVLLCWVDVVSLTVAAAACRVLLQLASAYLDSSDL